MAYEGYVDASSSTEIRGWVYNNSAPNDPLTVEVCSEGRLVATLRADQFRQDLLACQKGNGRHAFSYQLASDRASASLLTARVAGKPWQLPLAGPTTGTAYPMRFDRHLAHTLEYGLPTGECGFTDASPSSDEPAIVARLIEAYHRALEDDPEKKGDKRDMWSEVGAAHHTEILDLLRRRDVNGTAAYLRDAHAKGLTFGISQGTDTTNALRTREDARKLVSTLFLDSLASLGEFLGILDVESPEQSGQWGENLHGDPCALIARISAEIGIPIVLPPVIGSSFGIKTNGNVLAGRDIAALYAALRLRNIARDLEIAAPEVCEIGGGLGGTAYYAHRLGLRRYTIIDLPLIGVMQGYFLLRALPGTQIRLYGEDEAHSAAICLLPTYCFHRPAGKFDVLFNQDSMPEMHTDHSLGYLRQARHQVRRAFFSINQEARAPQTAARPQTVVRELVREVGGYRPVYRFRHWLRAGYVEELYRLETPN